MKFYEEELSNPPILLKGIFSEILKPNYKNDEIFHSLSQQSKHDMLKRLGKVCRKQRQIAQTLNIFAQLKNFKVMQSELHKYSKSNSFQIESIFRQNQKSKQLKPSEYRKKYQLAKPDSIIFQAPDRIIYINRKYENELNKKMKALSSAQNAEKKRKLSRSFAATRINSPLVNQFKRKVLGRNSYCVKRTSYSAFGTQKSLQQIPIDKSMVNKQQKRQIFGGVKIVKQRKGLKKYCKLKIL